MNAVKKIVRRLNRQWFNSVTNNHLVYNTCWEDPAIDRELLQMGSESSAVMISSAGCNTLDYLLDRPASIHCVDINPAQNALLELKRALVLHGNYHLLWQMFGKGKLDGASTIYRQSLRPHLSDTAQTYWDSHINYFRPSVTTSSFYFRGTAGSLANIVYKYIRHKNLYNSVEKLLDATSLAEQRYYFDELTPHLWNDFSRWLLQNNAVLSLLGVPQKQRALIDKEINGGLEAFIYQSLVNVFTNRPIHENYFWRVYLTGSYTPQCCPGYLKEDNFETIRNCTDRLDIRTCSFLNFLGNNPGTYSHFVLLDHQDWLANHQPEKLHKEWQLMLANARPGTKILFRSAGIGRSFVPEFVNHHVHFMDNETKRVHEKDRVGTYGSTHLAVVDAPL